MEQAIEELELRARQRQQKAEAKYEEKKAQRREKEKKTGKKCTGREPERPDKKAEDSKEQCNLSDSDARIMRKNKRAGFTQSYNAQAAVDADGSQLVVGQHVSQSASDYAELVNGVASIPSQLGKPGSVLADAGYVNGDAFDRLEKEGVEIYCSVHREDAHNEHHYDYRPRKASGREVKEPTDERQATYRGGQGVVCKTQPYRRTGLWDHQGRDGLSRVQSARQRESIGRMDAGLPGLQPQTPPPDGLKCDERSGLPEIGVHVNTNSVHLFCIYNMLMKI